MTEAITTKQEAQQLHQQIINYGTMAATALYEMCRCLKRMRDTEAYKEIGYETFERYAQDGAGIGQRQAYNYIRVYEQYGDTVLQSNAHLGIAKLELIARLPLAERQEVLASPETESESVAELKKRIAELTPRAEQASLFEQQLDEEKRENEELREDIAALKKEQTVEVHQGYTEEDLQKKIEAARKDAIAEQKKAAKAEIEQIKKRAKEDAERQAEKDKEKAIAEAVKAEREKADARTATLQKEVAAAAENAARLEKQLQLAGDEDTVAVSLLFEQVTDLLNKIGAHIHAVSERDADSAEKLRDAVCRLMDLGKNMVGK